MKYKVKWITKLNGIRIPNEIAIQAESKKEAKRLFSEYCDRVAGKSVMHNPPKPFHVEITKE